MKRLRDILPFLAVIVMTVCVASCSGHSDRPGLVALDSLIMQSPDSACERLAAYPADSLTTAADRAYHALLTTIADYKAYRPTTTDSVINIAVSHYDHNGANQDHRMRSLLYKGCVMEELGDIKDAARSYKFAQYSCPNKDYFHKGYIYYKLGCLFQSVSEAEQAENYYLNAITEFQKINEQYYSLNCIVSIGEVLRIFKPDTAFKYINEGLKLAIKLNDSYHIFASYSNLAGYYFYYNQFDKALEYSLLAINNSDITLGKKDVFYFACESYLEKSQLDSAQIVFNQMPSPQNAADSLLYCRCLSDIYKFKGDTIMSYVLSEEADKNKCKTDIGSNNGLSRVCTQIDHEYAANHNFWLFTGVTLTALLVLFVLFIQLYRRKKQASQLKYSLDILNIQLIESITELAQIQEGRIKINQDIETLKQTISQYMELLKSSIPWGVSQKEKKNKKICDIMDRSFFNTLYSYINIEFPNILNTLQDVYGLKEEEIQIVCLDLCRFPNYIIWSSTNLTNMHSLINKKKIIAKKVNNATSIADILNKIKN